MSIRRPNRSKVATGRPVRTTRQRGADPQAGTGGNMMMQQQIRHDASRLLLPDASSAVGEGTCALSSGVEAWRLNATTKRDIHSMNIHSSTDESNYNTGSCDGFDRASQRQSSSSFFVATASQQRRLMHKNWILIQRPPAPGVGFVVPTWVRVDQLTREEVQTHLVPPSTTHTTATVAKDTIPAVQSSDNNIIIGSKSACSTSNAADVQAPPEMGTIDVSEHIALGAVDLSSTTNTHTNNSTSDANANANANAMNIHDGSPCIQNENEENDEDPVRVDALDQEEPLSIATTITKEDEASEPPPMMHHHHPLSEALIHTDTQDIGIPPVDRPLKRARIDDADANLIIKHQ